MTMMGRGDGLDLCVELDVLLGWHRRRCDNAKD
jgi:hypothetical protein